jgi:hypothetical protein
MIAYSTILKNRRYSWIAFVEAKQQVRNAFHICRLVVMMIARR